MLFELAIDASMAYQARKKKTQGNPDEVINFYIMVGVVNEYLFINLTEKILITVALNK